MGEPQTVNGYGSNGYLEDLGKEEFMRLLDEQANWYLNMSIEEFLDRLDAGTLPDNAAAAHLKTLTGAAAATE
jgi:hypothetical protein